MSSPSFASRVLNRAPSLYMPAVPRSILIGLTAVGFAAVGMFLILTGHFTILAAAASLGIFLVVFVTNPGLSIFVVLIFLFLLGDLRRIISLSGDAPRTDPMLLVGPVFAILVALPILMHPPLKDPLAKAVLALMAIMMVEVVNPGQGSVVYGATGAIYYIVPLLWFWIGTRYGNYTLLRQLIYYGIIPLGVLAAALGALQTYLGFLPWEQAWIDRVSAHFAALSVGGFTRAFGYSVNGLEFADILMIATVSAGALCFARRRVFVLAIPITVWGLFIASVRSCVVHCAFGLAAAWALSSKKGRAFVVRMAFALIVGLVAIVFSARQASDSSGSAPAGSAAAASSAHQVQGLAHPFDSKYSSAGGHSALFLNGILAGIKRPIGYGLGMTAGASTKLGGSGDDQATNGGSTEVDISDIFVATGVVGGVLYLWIAVMVLRRTVSFGRAAPWVVGLPVLGIIFALFGQWLQVGLYAVTPTAWFLIGSLLYNGAQAEPTSRTSQLY
jgi:hypothetical protein